MRQLGLGLLTLFLVGCGHGQPGSALREQSLPPQVAAQGYARFASTPAPNTVAHELPEQLTPAAGVPGNPNAGRTLFIERGCGGCHSLTGLAGADGVAGPRLDNTTVRATIAGNQIPATPENLARWIYDPASLKAATTMPRPGVTQAEARDLAAFLYSLPQNRS